MITFVSKIEILKKWNVLKELITTYHLTKQTTDKSSLIIQKRIYLESFRDALSQFLYYHLKK